MDSFVHSIHSIIINMNANFFCYFVSVLGLDIVTTESLFGYEPAEYKENPSLSTPRPSEADQKVVLPDTSAFLTSPVPAGPSITFPKYNNYMADPNRFDKLSKIQLPLRLLGIKQLGQGELNVKNSLNNQKAVLSYVQYNELGALLPNRYIFYRQFSRQSLGSKLRLCFFSVFFSYC